MVSKIFALVGPSGSGKSHRASFVAMDRGVETIIDDGLLIHRGRIIAGHSAKREATRVAAVKRAIFDDPAHRQQMRDGLATIDAWGILILGTSQHMVEVICQALGLDQVPIEWISISDVSNDDERRIAQWIRSHEGKHVIPAPTMEVKKSFSGYLVDPLRFISRKKGHSMEVEKSIVRPTFSSLGRFYISDTVLKALVVYGARQVEHIVRASHVMVQSSPDGVTVHLDVTIEGAEAVFPRLRQVQKSVRAPIETMTSLNVLAVKVVARHIVWPKKREADDEGDREIRD